MRSKQTIYNYRNTIVTNTKAQIWQIQSLLERWTFTLALIHGRPPRALLGARIRGSAGLSWSGTSLRLPAKAQLIFFIGRGERLKKHYITQHFSIQNNLPTPKPFLEKEIASCSVGANDRWQYEAEKWFAPTELTLYFMHPKVILEIKKNYFDTATS